MQLNEAWRFTTDPQGESDKAEWFASTFDDSRWETVRTDTWWENQGHPGYNGVAWYRKRISLQKTDKRTILYFGAVDGDADIWLNGKHLYRHEGDVGDGNGWTKPFWIDITDKVVNGENTLTVKVNATVV